MQPVPTAPTAAEDGGLSTHVLHMTRLHAKRPLLVELRVINGPFEGGCRLQSGGGAWLACNTSEASVGARYYRLTKAAEAAERRGWGVCKCVELLTALGRADAADRAAGLLRELLAAVEEQPALFAPLAEELAAMTPWDGACFSSACAGSIISRHTTVFGRPRFESAWQVSICSLLRGRLHPRFTARPPALNPAPSSEPSPNKSRHSNEKSRHQRHSNVVRARTISALVSFGCLRRNRRRRSSSFERRRGGRSFRDGHVDGGAGGRWGGAPHTCSGALLA